MSDAKFAEECGKHRTEIWAYRTGQRVPYGHSAAAIIEALRRLGHTITVDELLSGHGKPNPKAA